jgi:hypothetical protein
MKLPLENVVHATLWDGVSCALVADSELDKAESMLVGSLGRDTFPGELYGSAARQLGVDRIIEVHCPPGYQLSAMLEPAADPGVVQAKGVLPSQTRENIEQNDFKILDP